MFLCSIKCGHQSWISLLELTDHWYCAVSIKSLSICVFMFPSRVSLRKKKVLKIVRLLSLHPFSHKTIDTESFIVTDFCMKFKQLRMWGYLRGSLIPMNVDACDFIGDINKWVVSWLMLPPSTEFIWVNGQLVSSVSHAASWICLGSWSTGEMLKWGDF